MSSIRKTKKRLKREIAEDKVLINKLHSVRFPTMRIIHLYDAISQSIKLKEQKLQQLKRKIR